MLIEHDGRAAAGVDLTTKIPHHIEGMWDVIETSLEVSPSGLEIVIDYAHSGGGDPCDQRFTFWVRADEDPELVVERSTEDLACM